MAFINVISSSYLFKSNEYKTKRTINDVYNTALPVLFMFNNNKQFSWSNIINNWIYDCFATFLLLLIGGGLDKGFQHLIGRCYLSLKVCYNIKL